MSQCHVYIQQEFKGWRYGTGMLQIISRIRIRQSLKLTRSLTRDASLALALTHTAAVHRIGTDHDINLSMI